MQHINLLPSLVWPETLYTDTADDDVNDTDKFHCIRPSITKTQPKKLNIALVDKNGNV